MDLAGDLFNFFGSIMVVSCSGRFIAHCSAIDAAYKPEMFEAYALPTIINSVIVTAYSQGGAKFPTGGKSTIALKARERFLQQQKGQQIRCNSGADG
jgi:hypothetical protein